MAAPALYRIRVQGHLRTEWSEWFDGMTITQEENGESELFGPVIDQPALHGLLAKVRDLGLSLISVNRVEAVVQSVGNQQDRN